MDHSYYMKIALEEACKAQDKDEVPVGAVLVDDAGLILAAAHNQTISASDPSAHAEILVLRDGAARLSNYRLTGTTLYSTIEPCMMCMGAIVHARVASLVYGAPDMKWGAAGSLYDFSSDARLNHRVNVVTGVEAEACKTLIQDFFRQKRKSVASWDSIT
jgi:tRNA(adenine34) deaminase